MFKNIIDKILAAIWGVKFGMYILNRNYEKAVKLIEKVGKRFPVSTDRYPGESFVNTLRNDWPNESFWFEIRLLADIYEAEKGRC